MAFIPLIWCFVSALHHRSKTDELTAIHIDSENYLRSHRFVQRAYKARLQRVRVAKLTPMEHGDPTLQ